MVKRRRCHSNSLSSASTTCRRRSDSFFHSWADAERHCASSWDPDETPKGRVPGASEPSNLPPFRARLSEVRRLWPCAALFAVGAPPATSRLPSCRIIVSISERASDAIALAWNCLVGPGFADARLGEAGRIDTGTGAVDVGEWSGQLLEAARGGSFSALRWAVSKRLAEPRLCEGERAGPLGGEFARRRRFELSTAGASTRRPTCTEAADARLGDDEHAEEEKAGPLVTRAVGATRTVLEPAIAAPGGADGWRTSSQCDGRLALGGEVGTGAAPVAGRLTYADRLAVRIRRR